MPSRPALAALAVAAASVAATTALSLPAVAATNGVRAAATGVAPATGPIESVSLALAPRDRASLTALVTAKGLTAPVRQARLDAALPGTARAADVAQRATALGLTVTATDEFSVDVQAPASRVLALFGSARAHNRSLPTAQALPQLPSTLAGLVDVAAGGDDTRPALLSHTLRSSSQSRSSAVAPSDGSLSVAQARGISRIPTATTVPSGSAPIIASLQFPSPNAQGSSGINATLADLHSFATANKIYEGSDFPAALVSTSSASGCTDVNSYGTGDQTPDEVALDQETLLVGAPQLRQRIYYAPNCGSGQDNALAQVYSDVTNGMPIVALTTSWGECEPEANAYLASDQTAINALLAKGVQVFAAAGDTGSYDCLGDPTTGDSVDDPGSVPGVISVGGTQGLRAGSLATWNDGSNATGGGFSCVNGSYTSGGTTAQVNGFTRPSYQSTAARTPTFPHNGFRCSTSSSARMVPDIATSGAEGLDVVVTEDQSCPSSCLIYGTSFSAPLAAGGYAQTLVQGGRTGAQVTSAGGLPSLLYGSQPANAITDVVQGNNGDYSAGVGWDPTTGLGSPKWPYVLSTVLNTTVPSAGTSSLPVNTKLTNGQSLTSPDGNTTLVMQGDGNLVIYDLYTGTPVPVLSFGTTGHPGAYAVLQGDSNLVVYDVSNAPLAATATIGAQVTTLQVLNNGTAAGITRGGLPGFVVGQGLTGYAGGDRVPAGGALSANQGIWSPGGRYQTLMQSDGTLVTYDQSTSPATVVSAVGGGGAGARAVVATNGQLQVVSAAGAVVSTVGSPAGNPHDVLTLSDAGVLTLLAASGQPLWTWASGSTGTATGNRADTLPINGTLGTGAALWSNDGAYQAVMQGDGNFVVYGGSAVLYATRTQGGGASMILQGDGNLVLYAGGRALWSSATVGRGGNRLVLQTDGNLVLYTAGNGAVWSSRTGVIG